MKSKSKKQNPISKHFSEMGRKSWKIRRVKLLKVNSKTKLK